MIMKKLIKYLSIGSVLVLIIFHLNSCRKNFSLDELNKLKNDSLNLEGTFAGSIINSELSLMDFIPENDSSFWVEVDDNDLLHIRLLIDDYMVFTMNEIFPILYPAPGGFPVPAGSKLIQGDTSKLKINEKMLGGKIYFKDPKITFQIDNEIPLVTFFQMDELKIYDGDKIAIDSASHSKLTITAPTDSATSVLSEFIIGKTEIPLLTDLFSPIPKYFSFELSTGSDAPQNLPYGVSGDEKMTIDVNLDFPVDIKLDTLIMSDTASFDMSNSIYNYINTAELKIKFKNGFPLDAYSQIYFANTDDDGVVDQIIDSVFTDVSNQLITADGWNLRSANANSEGVVISPVISDAIIVLDEEKISKLRDNNVSKIVIQAKLNSYDSQNDTYVKILSSYLMGIQIAVKADAEATIN